MDYIKENILDPLTAPSKEALEDLKKTYADAGQSQVFKFWESLSAGEQNQLFDQLSKIKPGEINEIAKRAKISPTDASASKIEPLPKSTTASIIDSSKESINQWYDLGMKLIANNKVAVVLMAGGQGTRLGSSDPKGCFNIGLPSGKSLFQIQAERIRKIEELSKGVVPWYVMTSGPTRKPTEAFFQKHNYFGLKHANVKIFEQGVLPCLDNDDKILLESKGKVAVAPDGNGGIYLALHKSGVLDDMKKRGIEHIHAYCVDNCLVKVADPVFLGFASAKKVEIATKVVRKRDASESVGLIVSKDNRPAVVEYSEISEEMKAAKEGEGDDKLLKFRAANIVNHYYSMSYLEKISTGSFKLPHHIANKKIPFVNLLTGEIVKPEKPNGIKLEQFVFDCFPNLSLNEFACMEVKREDEFSPLKNGRDSTEDNADTSKKDIMAQGKRWCEAAGAKVASGNGIEVSPLLSYGGEGLEKLKDQPVSGNYLDSLDNLNQLLAAAL